MPKDIEFLFDFGSPAAYLAWTQIDRIGAAAGARVIHRPLLLGGVFKATGNSSPVMIPAKGAYLMADLSRHAAQYGVGFGIPPGFPINTLGLMRAAAAVEDTADFAPLQAAIMQAMWVDRKDLRDLETLKSVLSDAGLDAQRIADAANGDAAKARLKRNTEDAVNRGAFGAPTFFVGNEMFFGQDRLTFVAEAAKG